MLFSGKENVFMCLIAFQKMFRKIFYGVWLCFWKYHRKHIFYLLLTFSHIFPVAKQIYNIIHSSIQKHKQNLEKKIIKSGQIERRRKRERRLGSTKGYDRCGASRDCDRRDASWDRNRREGEIAIGMKVRSRSVRRRDRDRRDALRDRDRRFARLRLAWCFARSRSARRWDRNRRRDLSPFACLWVVLSLSLSPFARLWALFFARLSFGSDLKVK